MLTLFLSLVVENDATAQRVSPQNGKPSSMIIRILSSLVLVPIALGAIWLGSPYFGALITLGGVLAATEWWRLMANVRIINLNLFWKMFGLIYIAIPCFILIWLRNIEPLGFQFVIWFFAVIWANDIGAYFIGKSIGGPKLAPYISPNKTWAGSIGGIVLALFISFALNQFSSIEFETWGLIIACILVSIFGQLGDLLESWVKRKLGIKDSGSLIPGHGGVLDRIDAILMGAPLMWLIVIVFQLGGLSWK